MGTDVGIGVCIEVGIEVGNAVLAEFIRWCGCWPGTCAWNGGGLLVAAKGMCAQSQPVDW